MKNKTDFGKSDPAETWTSGFTEQDTIKSIEASIEYTDFSDLINQYYSQRWVQQQDVWSRDNLYPRE